MTMENDLVERLREIYETGDHERLCQGREYSCTCGFDGRIEAAAREASSRIQALEAELATKTEALQGLLRCEYESAGMGLYDCVDKHGKPYQSADLDAQIKRAEAALSPALEEKTDV